MHPYGTVCHFCFLKIRPLFLGKTPFSHIFSSACTCVQALEQHPKRTQAHPKTSYLSNAPTPNLIRPLNPEIFQKENSVPNGDFPSPGKENAVLFRGVFLNVRNWDHFQKFPKMPKMPIFKNLCKGHEKVWDQNFHQNTFIDFETSQFAIFYDPIGFSGR